MDAGSDHFQFLSATTATAAVGGFVNPTEKVRPAYCGRAVSKCGCRLYLWGAILAATPRRQPPILEVSPTLVT